MGNRLDVMPPFGGFCLDTDRLQRRTHYFFGGGSGITPLFAMLHSVLLAEPYSVTHVAYGNRDGASILFRNRLRRLQTEYPDRLSVNHVISSPPMWSGFDYWRKGRIDRAAIEALFAENPPHAQDAQYYVCGPGRMNGAVKGALMELDVPANRIHMESYGGEVDADDSVKGIAAEALIMLEGQKRSVPVAASQTVLDAVRATGLAPPFSCQSGALRCLPGTPDRGLRPHARPHGPGGRRDRPWRCPHLSGRRDVRPAGGLFFLIERRLWRDPRHRRSSG